MFDMNGMASTYAMADRTRKPGTDTAGSTVLPPRANAAEPPVINNPLIQQAPVEQFQRTTTSETGTPLASQPSPQGAQQQAATPETSNPFQNAAMMASPRGTNFERILAQVATVFFGSQKDKTDNTEEKEKRRRHDFTLINVLGEPKVEESNNAQLGPGSE